MKTLVIPDIHGRNTLWPLVLDQEFDEVVFLGDYFDSFDPITPRQQEDNFQKIMQRARGDKRIVTLLGNHSFHYLAGVDETYSGYQHGPSGMYRQALEDNKDLLKICHQSGNYLFSHAGITKTWCKTWDIDLGNLAESVNELFKHKRYAFKFQPGRTWSNYGDDITQGPLWVRPRSLIQDMVPGYTHVVGHTPQQTINYDQKVWFVDNVSHTEYLIIENGVARKTSINENHETEYPD